MSTLKLLTITLLLLPTLSFANSKGVQRAEEGELFIKEDRVAVIVGVNQYSRYSGLNSLNYAVPDADALADFFKSQGYLVHLLKDADAQKHYILGAIRRAGDQLEQPGMGTFVFAFSGHGFGSGDGNYLAVSGSDADDINNTGLALADIRKAIRDTGARRRVLFIDACRNNPNSSAKGGDRAFVDDDSEGENILYSTRSGKLSYEDSSLGHGAFTHYVLKGLKGDASEEGVVTFSGLSRYVSKQVKIWVHDNKNAVQVPYRAGENTGVFVLAIGPEHLKPVPVVADRSARLTVKVEPRDARIRIMNIGPKYHSGMELALNESYDVLIDKKGYLSWRQTIQLNTVKQAVSVKLKKAPLPAAQPKKWYEPEMVKIPAGSFRMGDLTLKEHYSELPVHRVEITSFELSKYEVTFAQYDAYADATGKNKPSDEGWGRGSRPVINVSWHDASAYVGWLSKMTDKYYRLPSEAEWEYSARAGSESKYTWGDAMGDDQANCANCGSPAGKYKYRTVPVGQFSKNAFGLYDVHGNVAEWVEDNWHGNYNGAPIDGSAWLHKASNQRMLRGGSWFNNREWVSSAVRGVYGHNAHERDSSIGFRVARGL